jgi:hypothetical protein
VLLVQKAAAQNATPFEAAGFTMLATLMVLAIAEHWFLVAPMSANALWQFGVKDSSKGREFEDRKAFADAEVPDDGIETVEENASAFATASAIALDAVTYDDVSLSESRGLRPALESFGRGVSASR